MLFSRKRKHTIFLIHGIGGSRKRFGHMVKVLPQILNAKDPSCKYFVKNIEYATGHNELTPYDFSQDIDRAISRSFDEDSAKRGDKISLVMHSQGGLIGAIWMIRSLLGRPGYSSPGVIKHLDSFITLGTPFWGAKTAQWGRDMTSLMHRLGVKVRLPFGKRELEQMSFGSDLIFNFRMGMMDPSYKDAVDYVRKHVRLLNIIGVADMLNPLGIFISGSDKYEDDGAVPLASARFDFLYTQSIHSDYSEGDRLPASNSREVRMAPYVVVNALHESPLPEMENFPGIAYIPKACIRNQLYSHPTLPYLWRHILNKPIRQMDGRLGDFKTFLLDINVRVNADREYRCEEILVDIMRLDGSSLQGSNIEVSKFYELYARGQRKSAEHADHCRYYFTGSLKTLLDNRPEIILIKFSAPGLKTRFVEVECKPAVSSFVDISLFAAV